MVDVRVKVVTAADKNIPAFGSTKSLKYDVDS